MSISPLTLIRSAVETLLAAPVGDPPAAPTPAGDRIFGNRTAAFSKNELPALAVHSLEDEPAPEYSAINPVRQASILVEAHNQTKEEGGADTEQNAWLVERTVMDSQDLGLLDDGPVEIKKITWVKTSPVLKTPEGILPEVGQVEFVVTYKWRRPIEEQDLAPFLIIHFNQLGLPPEEGGAPVEVRVDLPQE